MVSFYDMWDRLNGKPYEDVPPPSQYKLADYDITTNPINGTESGGYELRPLDQSDMARYASDDVVNHYVQMHQGKNPTRLGEPMTDLQFRQFMGLPTDE